MLEGPNQPKLRFGVFEFDPQARELSKHGVRLKLQDQPIQVLTALLEQAGQIVPRDALQRRLWPDGTFVDFDQSLNKAVNKLREALGDSADKPVYIETLARRGYRFVAAVETDRSKPQEPESPGLPPPVERARAQSHVRHPWFLLAFCLLTVAAPVTGLWPVPAPTARVTQLTYGGRPDSIAVHGGRILYTSASHSPSASKTRNGTEFWSISTGGGQPRRERLPFLNPEYLAWLQPADPRQGVLLIFQTAFGASRGDMWLAEFDGSKPRRIGELREGNNYSVSPDLKTVLRSGEEGLFARPVDGGPERLLARIDWKLPADTVWHPSGERIEFNLLRQGAARFWELNANGTRLRPFLPEFQGEMSGTSWSPDGERLYLVSEGDI